MAAKIYTEITLEELTEKYVNTFDSAGKVARDMGVSYRTFRRALDRFGIKARGRVSDNPKLRDKEWLKEQYIDKMRSTRQIAEEVGSTPGAVYSQLKWLGLELRKSRVAWDLRFPEGRFGKDAANWRGGRQASGKSYVSVWSPDHPNASKDGYMLEHRLEMEKHLGRYLEKGEVVHHKNGDKKDNRIENLELFASHADHKQKHADAVAEVVERDKEIERLKKIIEDLGGSY